MQGSSRLVERIIQGAQKYFRGSSEENYKSVASRMRGFNKLLLFQFAIFYVSLCFLSKKKKNRKTPSIQLFFENELSFIEKVRKNIFAMDKCK